MRIRTFIVLALVAASIAVMYSCIEPFSPPETNSDENYLVIDGFLNVGNDTSRIELRRTQNVNLNANPIIETGAKLTAEEEAGGTYEFTEEDSGLYFLPPNQFNRSGKYRLRVKTRDGEEYLSEYVSVNITPVIDSLTYKFDPGRNAMVFYVNTHDDQSKTQFYRWKFDETWEYRSPYVSIIEVVDKELIVRKEDISKCWGRKNSGSILLGSTIKLSSDIIKNLPLNVVPVLTNKLFIKYSILVKQYGLSRDAFEYWTSLAKTTQGTGSLFDPQPSQVTGNFMNTTDRKKLAFGYFSVSTQETKRLTIEPGLGSYARCIEPDTLPLACSRMGRECASETNKLILNYYGMRSDSVLAAPPSCADCRSEGGNTVRPSFW